MKFLRQARYFVQHRSFFYWIVGSIMACVVAACSTSTEEPSDVRLGYDYFPLTVGTFWVYAVEEITHESIGDSVTRQYQIKELVADTLTDLAGDPAFRIHRFSRVSDSHRWQLDSVWTAKRTLSQAIRTENNLSFVKLVFPPRNGQRWNVNALNHNFAGSDSLGRDVIRGDTCEIQSADKPFVVLEQPYDRTVTVMHQNDSSACGQDRRLEVFARNVGLIYKETIQVAFKQINNACEGGDINFGTQRYQRLRQYGRE